VDSSFFLSLSFSFSDILAYSYRPSVQTISNCVKRMRRIIIVSIYKYTVYIIF
jgi:hypothetical protein